MKLTLFWIILIFSMPPLFDATLGCSYEPPRASEVSHPNSYLCACSCEPGVRTRMLRVSANEDDAEESGGGAVKIDEPDLDFGQAVVGVRFRGVDIPPGATIVSAQVQFTAAESDTGNLTQEIHGEAADDAAVFSAVSGNLSGRAPTMNTVTWMPPNWTSGDADGALRTPELKDVVQEIVSRPGWDQGHALALLFVRTAGGSTRRAFSRDGRADLAALLEVEYTESPSPVVGPQDLQVCMPAGFNENLMGGVMPTDADLMADCTGRVQNTLGGLAEACSYPSSCTCTLTPDSRKFATSCDDPCAENLVEPDCSDFDPVGGVVDATNATGDEPVCVAHSPLVSGIFGRRTACLVEGQATVKVEDDSKMTPARGIVLFSGDPCPGQSCAVGMEYRLDLDAVTFSNFFGSATFSELAGLGESLPGGEAMLSSGGIGMFAPNTTETSARGRKGSEAGALVSGNDDVLDVAVNWGQVAPMCAVEGAVVGTVDPEAKRCENAGPDAGNVCADDSECTDDPECSDEVCNCEAVGEVPLTLALDLTGSIVNQPPAAVAGAAQIVECNVPNGAEFTLDGSGSNDLDANIILFDWFRGSRTGEKVGFDEMSAVEQPLGTQSYVLRVIDALAQADEDVTQATVQDTTPPEISVALSPTSLWPPNHKLVKINATVVTSDICDPDPEIKLESITSNESDNGLGDGNTTDDIQAAIGTDATMFKLRSERMGPCTGRVYTVTYSVTDDSGNSSTASAEVAVPHDMGQGKAKGKGKNQHCDGTGGGNGGGGGAPGTAPTGGSAGDTAQSGDGTGAGATDGVAGDDVKGNGKGKGQEQGKGPNKS